MDPNRSALDDLDRIASRIHDAKVTVEAFEDERDQEIRRAHNAGVSAVDIAAAARLSRPRVYQILTDR